MFSKAIQMGGTDWDEQLPFVLFAYRCCKQKSTRGSPFFMLYGRDPVLPTEEAPSQPVYADYPSQIVQNLGKSVTERPESLEATKETA